jgi:hypothetical protein
VDIAGLESKDGKRIDPAIHAGHDSKVLLRNRRERSIREVGRVCVVPIDKVLE